ncbi:thioredoxin family protein [Methanoregula sp.]|uniref:thioredoxin family protein n=1 Tax=Methanoregula sp. TaxID=2052170 RepID=UPI00356AA49F
MDRIIKIFIAVFAIIAAATVAVILVTSSGTATTTPTTAVAVDIGDGSTVFFFYGEECPHCKKIEPFIDNLSKKYPDVEIQKLEIWHNQTNQQIYTSVNAAAGITSPSGVPEIVVGKVVLVGEVEIPQKLEAYVQAIEKKKVNPAP